MSASPPGQAELEADAIVVGAGAAGSWAAKVLCERGLEVLLLDAGPALEPSHAYPSPPPAESPLGARLRGLLGGQAIQARCPAYGARSRQFFVSDRDNPYSTPRARPFNWFRGRQVGGRLHVWARLVPRLSAYELEAGAVDGSGPGWPLSYEDLAPHYERIERFLGVRGEADGLETMPDGAFRPPIEPTAAELRFRDAITASLPDRRVVSARVADHDPDPTPAPLRAAEASGRLRILPGCVATRVETERRDGRASGVRFIERGSGSVRRARAPAIVLAASTIETVRLLLNSASPAHPGGLGNGSGRLGTGLMDHVLSGLGGPLAEPAEPPDADPYDFGTATGFMVPRFQNLDGEQAAFQRGYGVQGGIGRGPGWYMLAHGEMLARDENRIELDPARRDRWGMPTAWISCAPSPNEIAMAADQRTELARMAATAGLAVRTPPTGGPLGRLAYRVWRRRLLTPGGAFLPGSAAHEIGGAPIGVDHRRSVLNPLNRCWDADNVFVVDGAAFASGCWQNVTLTIMALASRACEHLADEHAAGRL